MISRVFQKTGSGTGNGGATTSAGGSKKSRLNSGPIISLYPEPSSPSSVSLPPLLDSSPYPTSTATAATHTDRDSCTYDSPIPREHVSCFSTIAAAATSAATGNFNSGFEIYDPSSARFSRNVGVSAFPSLRSLQENLQLPFFFPPVPATPFHGDGVGGNVDIGGCNSTVNWPSLPEESKPVGPSELDCMWTY